MKWFYFSISDTESNSERRLLLSSEYYYKLNCVFQGFKNHQLHDVLCDPGSADLTADVDFSFFSQLCLSTKAGMLEECSASAVRFFKQESEWNQLLEIKLSLRFFFIKSFLAYSLLLFP